MNCVIMHGCLGSSDRNYPEHWIPWAKDTLTKKGILTETPIASTPWLPEYDKFKAVFEKCLVDENSVLVGHSGGGAFLVRWLGETKKKIRKLILVAPWKINNHGDKYRDEFYTYTIDATIKDRVGNIVMFTSNDEYPEGKESLRMFHDALGGEIINLKDHGHYRERNMGTVEFPELIEAILK